MGRWTGTPRRVRQYDTKLPLYAFNSTRPIRPSHCVKIQGLRFVNRVLFDIMLIYHGTRRGTTTIRTSVQQRYHCLYLTINSNDRSAEDIRDDSTKVTTSPYSKCVRTILRDSEHYRYLFTTRHTRRRITLVRDRLTSVTISNGNTTRHLAINNRHHSNNNTKLLNHSGALQVRHYRLKITTRPLMNVSGKTTHISRLRFLTKINIIMLSGRIRNNIIRNELFTNHVTTLLTSDRLTNDTLTPIDSNNSHNLANTTTNSTTVTIRNDRNKITTRPSSRMMITLPTNMGVNFKTKIIYHSLRLRLIRFRLGIHQYSRRHKNHLYNEDYRGRPTRRGHHYRPYSLVREMTLPSFKWNLSRYTLRGVPLAVCYAHARGGNRILHRGYRGFTRLFIGNAGAPPPGLCGSYELCFAKRRGDHHALCEYNNSRQARCLGGLDGF